MRMIFDSGRPAIFLQRSNASSSSEKTVTRSLSCGRPNSLVISFQASSIATILEIVAEGEVAEHLEEGVVPGGVADIVEVVVLAAGAHAFLRRDGARIGPLLDAGEDVLELHHAGVGEHQRRVVARHERARRHDLVPVLREIIEKGRPDFVDAAHWERCSGMLARPRGRARCLFRHGSNRGARVCRGALPPGRPGRSPRVRPWAG